MKSVKRALRVKVDIDKKINEIAVRNNWSYSKVINVILESWIYEN